MISGQPMFTTTYTTVLQVSVYSPGDTARTLTNVTAQRQTQYKWLMTLHCILSHSCR